MLQILKPAEVLPVRILYPTCHNRFIRFVERMLEKMQTDHQASRLSGPSHILTVTVSQLPIETVPIDLRFE